MIRVRCIDGGNKQAREFVENMMLGRQTEQSSFCDAVDAENPPSDQPNLIDNGESVDDQLNGKLPNGLWRRYLDPTEMAVVGEVDVSSQLSHLGASANLCEALAKLINPFPSARSGLSWAQLERWINQAGSIRFPNDNVSILNDAAKVFRERESRSRLILSVVLSSN